MGLSHKVRNLCLAVAFVGATVLPACQSTPVATPTTNSSEYPTSTPTAVYSPTPALEETVQPSPTNSPVPTATYTPTNTPVPTNTPLPSINASCYPNASAPLEDLVI